jgi:hypothetical protein
VRSSWPDVDAAPPAGDAAGSQHGHQSAAVRFGRPSSGRGLSGDVVRPTAASAHSDPDAPALERHARGNALALLRFGLTRQRNMHTVTRGRPRIHPEVVGVTSHKVTLRDCVDDRRWLEYKTSGGLMDKVPGSHSRADVTVTQVKNVWKVSKLYLHGPGSC